ncbi:thioredoxin domain-containing protein [Uliginosibacterium sp. 31-16]|uniref:DsbA family protein n=1 Tax=Uliginosibacterium sp. 31-16 TaxID=3068315 RepID=UPI00273D2326|nr:thioredoxin domain-containing protein [Uliginosibacterium sp. 31-16]MDP5239473.1 thioredoxin domain-containing protein [Uliginosibacterium sp. 31-16]
MKQPLIVAGAAVALVVAFIAGAYVYTSRQNSEVTQAVQSVDSPFKRANSPSMGTPAAKVEITEFFDPACEACRAFYPEVKKLIVQHAGKVRLTLRYAAFHDGSDYVVKILEAARLQGQDVYQKALEATLDAQPVWAEHGRPQPQKVWGVLAATGLDIERARRDMERPEIVARLQQDAADIAALNVRQTPTFFINGKPLRNFGQEGLRSQLREEIGAAY